MKKLRIMSAFIGTMLIVSTFVSAQEFKSKLSNRSTSDAAIGGSVKTVNDFDGDGKTDFSVFRPSDGVWYILLQSGNYSFQKFGASGDTPIAEDFDGDRKSDIAVWRKGVFYVLRSSDNAFFGFHFGLETDDPTVCRDYDGDGKADFAVYRRGGGSGNDFNSYWYIRRSSDNTLFSKQRGVAIDVPAPGDYDGDGIADLTTLYSSVPYGSPLYFVTLQSTNNSFNQVFWGAGGDISAPGDYDGDGITDFAVWRPGDGSFYILTANGEMIYRRWGQFGDKPVPGDYDGDGSTDFAVWRPSNGTFYVLLKSGDIITRNWGLPNDIPTANYQVH